MSELLNHIIKNKYKVLSLIGKGNFSEVLQCINQNTNTIIAMKVEPIDTIYKTIVNEAKIINYLQNNKCKYIPTIYWYGKYLNYNCLAISYYDCSLATYIQNNRLTLKEINEYTIQLLSIINEIHNNFVIHRDIKPDNFMFKNNKLYIIDYGYSQLIDKKLIKKYNTKNLNHKFMILGFILRIRELFKDNTINYKILSKKINNIYKNFR